MRVTALVPINFTQPQVAGRLNDVLRRFQAGDRQVWPKQQRTEAELERATFVATARLALDDLHDLVEGSKQVSTEGPTLPSGAADSSSHRAFE